jgi:hypothetical protein
MPERAQVGRKYPGYVYVERGLGMEKRPWIFVCQRKLGLGEKILDFVLLTERSKLTFF